MQCKKCSSKTRKIKAQGMCATCLKKTREEKSKADHEKSVQAKYGLAPGEYDQLYEFQGGRCALCQWARGGKKRLAVDHDHKTGKVRGLLCTTCNTYVLGRAARDGVDFFERGVDYLTFPPYDMMKAPPGPFTAKPSDQLKCLMHRCDHPVCTLF